MKHLFESRFALGAAAFGLFALVLAIEWATEREEVELVDFLGDASVLALTVASAVFAALLFGAMARQRTEMRVLADDLETARRDGAHWRQEVETHANGLRTAIDRQFDAWALTPAERDVAYLILKGFSHKEIASLRETSERTARQQAQHIYRKARIAGRAAFVAFFLEDLLAPDSARGLGADPPKGV